MLAEATLVVPAAKWTADAAQWDAALAASHPRTTRRKYFIEAAKVKPLR